MAEILPIRRKTLSNQSITTPYEKKFLEWDVKLQTNKQKPTNQSTKKHILSISVVQRKSRIIQTVENAAQVELL